MTTGFLTLRVEGGEINEAFALSISALDDLSGLFREIHPAFVARSDRMFGSAGFGAWPMYWETGEAQYAMAKASILGWPMTTRDLLRWDFGGMERLAPSLLDPGHPDHVAEIEPTKAAFGTSVEYAINHETGTGTGPEWGGSAPIPQRQLTATDDEFLSDVQQLTSDYAGFIADTIGRTTVGMSKADVLLERTGIPSRGLPVRV